MPPCACAGIVRSLGLLQTLGELGGAGAVIPPGARVGLLPAGAVIPELQGDFSLNAANALTAGLLLAGGPRTGTAGRCSSSGGDGSCSTSRSSNASSSSNGGGSNSSRSSSSSVVESKGRCGGAGATLSSLSPTHDLNADQVVELAAALGPAGAAALEAVVHQHLPIFHTEHCVFARFLSDGNSYKDCGHPCESTGLHLRDGGGKDHLVLADMGCRNTVFNAQVRGRGFGRGWAWAGTDVDGFGDWLERDRGVDRCGWVSDLALEGVGFTIRRACAKLSQADSRQACCKSAVWTWPTLLDCSRGSNTLHPMPRSPPLALLAQSAKPGQLNSFAGMVSTRHARCPVPHPAPQAQSAVWNLADFARAGVRRMRVEMVDEPPEFVAPLLGTSLALSGWVGEREEVGESVGRVA
eukprot:366080-Chlamydomonas_euryale.AAC.1